MSIEVRQYTEYLILQKTTQLDIAFFESSTFYDQMDTVLRETYRSTTLAWRSIDMLGSLVGLSALLGLLLQLHPLAIVVLLLTSLPQTVLGGYYANRFYGLKTQQAAARRMATYLAELISIARCGKRSPSLWPAPDFSGPLSPLLAHIAV